VGDEYLEKDQDHETVVSHQSKSLDILCYPDGELQNTSNTTLLLQTKHAVFRGIKPSSTLGRPSEDLLK